MADNEIYVAATSIEWESEPGKSKRIFPGRAIPDDFPEDSFGELSEHGSIVTKSQYEEQAAEADRRRQPVTLSVGQIEDLSKRELVELVRGEAGAADDAAG
jgi:hypothetical protein